MERNPVLVLTSTSFCFDTRFNVKTIPRTLKSLMGFYSCSAHTSLHAVEAVTHVTVCRKSCIFDIDLLVALNK